MSLISGNRHSWRSQWLKALKEKKWAKGYLNKPKKQKDLNRKEISDQSGPNRTSPPPICSPRPSSFRLLGIDDWAERSEWIKHEIKTGITTFFFLFATQSTSPDALSNAHKHTLRLLAFMCSLAHFHAFVLTATYLVFGPCAAPRRRGNIRAAFMWEYSLTSKRSEEEVEYLFNLLITLQNDSTANKTVWVLSATRTLTHEWVH